MKKRAKLFAVMVCVLSFLCIGKNASAFGLNAASPLRGYDLGNGSYATLVGVQDGASLVGQTITEGALDLAILSGTVDGWYYAAGNTASAMFNNIAQFTPFVSDTVVAVGARADRIWDSLYAIHSGTVVFSNGFGGTATMGTLGTRIQGNPFVPIPAAAWLLGTGLVGLVAVRRKFRK